MPTTAFYIRDSEDEDEEDLLSPDESTEGMPHRDSSGSNPLPVPSALPPPTELNPSNSHTKSLKTSTEKPSTDTTHVSDSIQGSAANHSKDYLHLVLNSSEMSHKADATPVQRSNQTNNSGKSIYDFDQVDSDDDDVEFLGPVDKEKCKRSSEKKSIRPVKPKAGEDVDSDFGESEAKGRKRHDSAQKKRTQSAMAKLGEEKSSENDWRQGESSVLDAAGKRKATRSNTNTGDLAPLLPKKTRKPQRTSNSTTEEISLLEPFSAANVDQAHANRPEDRLKPPSSTLHAPLFMVDLTHDHIAFPSQKKAEYNVISSEPTSTATHLSMNPSHGSFTLESTFQDPPGIYPTSPANKHLYQEPVSPALDPEPVVQIQPTEPENTESSLITTPPPAKKTKKRAKTDLGLGGAEGDHTFGIVASEWRAAKGKAKQNMSRSKTFNDTEFADETEDNWQEEFEPKPKQKKPPKKRKKPINGVPDGLQETPKQAETKKKRIIPAIILGSDDDGALDELSTQVDPGVLQHGVGQGDEENVDGENSYGPQPQRIVKLNLNSDSTKSELQTNDKHSRTKMSNMAARKKSINFGVDEESNQSGVDNIATNSPETHVKPPNPEIKIARSRKRKPIGDNPENEDLQVHVVTREPSSSLSPPPPEFDPVEESPKAKAHPKKTAATKAKSGTGTRGRKKSKLEIDSEKYELDKENVPEQSKDSAIGTEIEASTQLKKPQPKATRKKSAKVKTSEKPPVSAEIVEDEAEEKEEKAEVTVTPEEGKKEYVQEKKEAPASIVNPTPARKTSEPSSRKPSESSGKKFSWQKTPYRVGLSRRANIEPLLRSVRKSKGF
ncbi:hypothetical protein RUND412_010672 [Rhizina undulata]